MIFQQCPVYSETILFNTFKRQQSQNVFRSIAQLKLQHIKNKNDLWTYSDKTWATKILFTEKVIEILKIET